MSLVFIALLLLSTLPGWHKEQTDTGSEIEVRPFPSRPVTLSILALLTLSSLLIFVSVFWQHVASSAAVAMGQSLSYGAVKGKVGIVAMALGWGAVFLDVLAALAICVFVVSIHVLAEAFD